LIHLYALIDSFSDKIIPRIDTIFNGFWGVQHPLEML
jgi:hypothetical protein